MFPIYHIPKTDCPYESDISFYNLSALERHETALGREYRRIATLDEPFFVAKHRRNTAIALGDKTRTDMRETAAAFADSDEGKRKKVRTRGAFPNPKTVYRTSLTIYCLRHTSQVHCLLIHVTNITKTDTLLFFSKNSSWRR